LSEVKHDTLAALAKCIQDAPQAAAKHVFADGTVRRTLATHSLPASANAPSPGMLLRGDAVTATSCQNFATLSTTFRQKVQEVTETFAARLEELVLAVQDVSTNPEPLLRTRGAEETAYLGLTQAVHHGDHLEHFHSYERQEHAQEEESSQDGIMTVDWHLDQGLFLVFAPGLQQGKPADGFYVQLPDGDREMVKFEEQDDLIILLGDALHQILNPVLGKPLRIPPHALTVPYGQRVWYGRMVLPPADALVPSTAMTYGELRNQLIESAINPDESSLSTILGCSSPTLQARHLEMADCDPDTQFFCWHRCFNLTADLTQETCQAQELDLACINDQRQLWNGDHNNAFAPGCVDLDTAEYAAKKTDTPTSAPVPSSSLPAMVVSVVWVTLVTMAVVLFG
jgi:hypothetical protein